MSKSEILAMPLASEILASRDFYGNGFTARVLPVGTGRNPSGAGVCTYFIQGARGGPIKIGRSRFESVHSRLSSLQIGNPDVLVIRMLLEGNYEGCLHRQFWDDHLRGEWFLATLELATACGGIPEDAGVGSVLAAMYERGWRNGVEEGVRQGAREMLEAAEGARRKLDLYAREYALGECLIPDAAFEEAA